MIETISFRETNQFSDLILDYLDEQPFFDNLVSEYPSLESIEKLASQRQFETSKRTVLFESLVEDYKNYDLPMPDNLSQIKDSNAYTITTGHQLNLLTGPVYAILKIASVINLCKQLNARGKYTWLPVFWMATEDHDLDEINHINLYGNKPTWSESKGGAVGEMSLDGIDDFFKEIAAILNERFDPSFLKELKACYNSGTLAEAHFRLIHKLFGADKLIIVDGNKTTLKTLFAPIMSEELTSHIVKSSTLETNKVLDKAYKTQAFVRDINLFYLTPGSRNRIVLENNIYKVLDTSESFSLEEILDELKMHPERFSPNVLMRPVYQETILPNVGYIGGGGEIAYWLQLKALFAKTGVDFPALILRTSAGFINTKDARRIKEAGFSMADVFQSEKVIGKRIVDENGVSFDLIQEKQAFDKVFATIKNKIVDIDRSLEDSVKANQARLEKRLADLEKKVIKAQKRTLETEINRVMNVRKKLLPYGGLQERRDNFVMHYHKDFIETLITHCNPISKNVVLVVQS